MLNEEGHEIALTLIKATYRWDAAGTLVLDDAQAPVRFADEYLENPVSPVCVSNQTWRSSSRKLMSSSTVARTRREADALSSWKCSHGSAAPQRDCVSPETALEASAVRRHRLSQCRSGMNVRRGATWLIQSEDTSEVRIREPRSVAEHRIKRRFQGRPRRSGGASGIGAIARTWWPRSAYAGTYDSSWQENGCRFCRSILIANSFKQRRMV